MKSWRYIDSGQNMAGMNMAIDEALLRAFKSDDAPILRLYAWEKALSFGRFAKVEASVDISKLQQSNIAYVRRITGGGTLVHGHDLSYALIVPKSFVKKRGVKESYRLLCMFLLKTYEALGLSAQFAGDLNLQQQSAPICLAGHEVYDIMIEGMKMGGNAQCYLKEALLQHGSIPFSFEIECFEPLFLQDSGLHDAASFAKLGKTIAMEKLKEILCHSLCEVFDTSMCDSALTSEEMGNVTKLIREKYAKDTWNLHKT